MKNLRLTLAFSTLMFTSIAAQHMDINQMPKPGPTPTVNIAKPVSFKLKNGLTVMVVENKKLPRVNMTLSMDRPPIYGGDKAGIEQIFAQQLGNGTQSIPKDEFNKKVDFLGARMNFTPSGGSLNTLSKYFPELLQLFAQSVVQPKFDAAEVQKAIDKGVEGLKSEEKSVEAIAERVSTALMFGKDNAFGEFTTEQNLRNVKLEDVVKFYSEHFIPNNAYLVIVGDVSTKDIKPLIEKSFAGWKPGNTKYPTPPSFKNAPVTEINVVNVPTAVQSVIQISNHSTQKMNDPMYFSSIMANYILGGGGEGRLFMNLREKNAFTYGAYSSLSTNKYAPQFTAESSVRTEVTDKAIQEIINELKGIKTVSDEELQNAKSKLKGDFIRSLEKPETIGRFAVNKIVQKLPENFYTDYLKSVDAVTKEDIQKAAEKNILWKSSKIFVAGNASEFADKVEKLGYKVSYFDNYANPTAKPSTSASSTAGTVDKKEILNKFISSMGGLDKLNAVKSLSFNATATMQGMELKLADTYAEGGKRANEISMMGQSLSKMVFDGKDGYMMVQGKKSPLPDEVKQNLLKQGTQVFSEVDAIENGNYKGIVDADGKKAHSFDLGGKTYLFDTNTGERLGNIITSNMMGETLKVPTYYSNFKEVNGVKLPYTIKMNMQGQELLFNVDSYEINKVNPESFK